MSLADVLFVDVYLSPLEVVVVVSTSWHRLRLSGLVPRTDLRYVCAGSTPFCVVAARCDTRLWPQKRTRRIISLPSAIGPFSVSFVPFPFQSVLEFPSLSGEGIHEFVHVGVFGVGLA